MSTYAQISDCKSYSTSLATLSDAALQSALDAAEKDIDSLFLGRPLVVATGRRWDITDASLTTTTLNGLRDAACAQTEYRIAQGPAFFTQAQYASVKGPDFTTTGKLPRVGPKAVEELLASGCIPAMARTVP